MLTFSADLQNSLSLLIMANFLYQVDSFDNITWKRESALSNRRYHGYSYTTSSRSSIHCVMSCGTSTDSCLLVVYDQSNSLCYIYDSDVTDDPANSNYDVIEGYQLYVKDVFKDTPTTSPPTLADICLTPYVYDPTYDICYRLETSSTRNFDSARSACLSEGAQLICLNTETRLDFINNVISQAGEASTIFWFGGDDYDTEGTWVCPGGQLYPITSTFWHDGEPSNSFATGEQCGVLQSKKFNDGRCARSEKYICEKVV